MLVLLEPLVSARFVAEAGPLWSLRAPSQALIKANGYREVFQFWHELNCHVALPRTKPGDCPDYSRDVTSRHSTSTGCS